MTIIIGGALGRMGHEVAQLAKSSGMEIACGVDIAYTGQAMDFPVVTGFDQVTKKADVLIDFSRPEGLPELLTLLQRTKMPAVLCTTGYTDVEIAAIERAGETVPILRSANMSLGINVMMALVRMASTALGDEYDIEIVEKHHRMKVDSPSGTAVMLYDQANLAKGGDRTPTHGRYGRCERRTQREIGLHAVRGGTVTGEHEVGFYGNGEQVILTHRAENRSLFAQGAIRAGQFLQHQPAGLYTMQHVVDDILSGMK